MSFFYSLFGLIENFEDTPTSIQSGYYITVIMVPPMPTQTPLQLAQVVLKDTNGAIIPYDVLQATNPLGGITSQSTVSRINDNQLNPQPRPYPQIYHSDGVNNTFQIIILGTKNKSTLSSVDIYNRSDCCSERMDQATIGVFYSQFPNQPLPQLQMIDKYLRQYIPLLTNTKLNGTLMQTVSIKLPPVNQSVPQVVTQSVPQIVTQPVNQAVPQVVTQQVNQAVTQAVNQSVSQPTNQAVAPQSFMMINTKGTVANTQLPIPIANSQVALNKNVMLFYYMVKITGINNSPFQFSQIVMYDNYNNIIPYQVIDAPLPLAANNSVSLLNDIQSNPKIRNYPNIYHSVVITEQEKQKIILQTNNISANAYLARVDIYNRGDCCAERMNGVRVEIFKVANMDNKLYEYSVNNFILNGKLIQNLLLEEIKIFSFMIRNPVIFTTLGFMLNDNTILTLRDFIAKYKCSFAIPQLNNADISGLMNKIVSNDPSPNIVKIPNMLLFTISMPTSTPFSGIVIYKFKDNKLDNINIDVLTNLMFPAGYKLSDVPVQKIMAGVSYCQAQPL